MIERVKNWLTERRERTAAYSAAWEAFKEFYPDRSLVRWKLKQHRLTAGELIVTVCYGNTKPPRRSWWIKRNENVGFEELSYVEAAKLIDIPVWR